MFIAKFNQATSEEFIADKHGTMPYIGEVLAGQSRGTIMNGTMFERGDNKVGKLYLCDNHVDPEYPDNVNTTIIAEVGVMDFITLRKELGAPSLKLSAKSQQAAVNANEVEDEVEADAEVPTVY